MALPADANDKTLVRDANDKAVQIAATFQTRDGAGTPNNSPQTVTSGAVTTITVPTGALAMRITPTEDLFYSEESALTYKDIVLANTTAVVGVYDTGSVYLKASSTTAVVYFQFGMMG